MEDLPKYGHQLSYRENEFNIFSRIVRGHIAQYTIPQYGDAPTDEVESWSPEQCVLAIQKYTKRFEASKRGRLETLRDIVKIAHFACITFYKMEPAEDEITKIWEGKI
jgi:hypothetical protein